MNINNYNTTNRCIISNDKYKAQMNYKKFENLVAISQEITDNENMLCIVNTMEADLNDLVASGRVNEGDCSHRILSGLLIQQCDIKIKNVKSVQDTVYFYDNFKQFNDVKSRLMNK